MFYRFFRSKEILYGYPLHVFQTLKKHIKCDIALKIIADLHSDFIIGYRPNNNVDEYWNQTDFAYCQKRI